MSNMSQEPIYGQGVYCTLRMTDGSEYTATVTDRDILQKSGDDEERPEGITSQGPLNRGDFMGLGTFRNILDITVERNEDLPDDLSRAARTGSAISRSWSPAPSAGTIWKSRHAAASA